MPNIWLPEDMLPGFRQFSNKFYGELWKAAENIFYALALGLGIDEEDLIARLHSYSENSLSYKHYPAVPASDFKSHEKERLGSHSDLTSVTLLFQDDCGGLEVEKQGKRGEFFPVDPVEGSMIVNIGDVLMRWSNGTPIPSLLAFDIRLRDRHLTSFQTSYCLLFTGYSHHCPAILTKTT